MSNLAEHLDRVLPETEEERAAFRIESKEQAGWALRKMAHLQRKLDENKRIADAERYRIDEWEREEAKQLERDMAFFRSLLTSYHQRVISEDPKAKTIKLPHGILKCRKQQPEYIKDDEALLAWVKANRPDLVEVKESTKWGELKKALVLKDSDGLEARLIDPATGEVVDGVTAIVRQDKFDVEVIV